MNAPNACGLTLCVAAATYHRDVTTLPAAFPIRIVPESIDDSAVLLIEYVLLFTEGGCVIESSLDGAESRREQDTQMNRYTGLVQN